MPGQLAIDLGSTIAIAPVHGSRHGHDQGGILVGHVRRVEAIRILFTNHIGAHVPFHESRMHHQGRQETEVAGNAPDEKSVQRRAHVGRGFFPGMAP